MITLSADEVLSVHCALTKDFERADDPISPPGVRSKDLLESAVSRQNTALGGNLKYRTPYDNAASLAYGICCNHPFYNGNKRAALVSMLCHLDRNDLMFDNIRHDELYGFMLKVAGHGFCEGRRFGDQSDFEVAQMAKWIRKRVRRVERNERVITYRELRSILGRYGFIFANYKGNFVDIFKEEEECGLFGLRKRVVQNRVMHIPYPGDGKEVARKVLKSIRDECSLSEDDGIDSRMFYQGAHSVDYFVQKYRGLLRRLSKV